MGRRIMGQRDFPGESRSPLVRLRPTARPDGRRARPGGELSVLRFDPVSLSKRSGTGAGQGAEVP